MNNIPKAIEVKDTENNHLNVTSISSESTKVAQIGNDEFFLTIAEINNDHFKIGTHPYAKKVSFTFNDYNNELFSILKNLIVELIADYHMFHHYESSIAFNAEERYIAFKSCTIDPNILKLEYNYSVTEITLTIYLNPRYDYPNNFIIIERESMFYLKFKDLLDKLIALSDKETPKKVRKSNFIERLLKK
ncbi:MAG: hypothetical protein NC483_02325 [Ruminococcus sp.]|nr:hypothetical protein [Ruminococcus sp.]